MEFDEQYVVDDFFIGAKLPANICIVPINSSIIFVFKLLFDYFLELIYSKPSTYAITYKYKTTIYTVKWYLSTRS